MAMFIDYGYTSLNKKYEELCGDRVEFIRNENFTTLVLADGLGSGVKANILSTLTSKILCTMVANNMDLVDCIETILQSLPVCKVRNVAYSTFSIIHVNDDGEGYLFEFDNPEAIFIHNGACCDLEREKIVILNKTVYKSVLKLQDDDAIMVMSDGVIHAGIGMTLNFGWQREEVKEHLNRVMEKNMSAICLSSLITGACHDLYMGLCGDDTTVATIKFRKSCDVHLMVGPPVDKESDTAHVKRFLTGADKTIVCGGTSSQIVARYLQTEIEPSIEFIDIDVPPIGYIEGIDLTTEGVLTLRKLLEISEKYLTVGDLTSKTFKQKDGASRIAKLIFEEASTVRFFVGQSINKAHLNLPIATTMKLKLVESIAENLKLMGKTVEVSYD